MLDRRAWQYLLLASVGKCQGGQAKLQLTGHLKLEPSFSQGSSYMTSLCLFLGGGVSQTMWLHFPFCGLRSTRMTSYIPLSLLILSLHLSHCVHLHSQETNNLSHLFAQIHLWPLSQSGYCLVSLALAPCLCMV